MGETVGRDPYPPDKHAVGSLPPPDRRGTHRAAAASPERPPLLALMTAMGVLLIWSALHPRSLSPNPLCF